MNKALELLKDGTATVINAAAGHARRIPGEERACRAGQPLPHNPAVSRAERNSWRGARIIFGRERGREKVEAQPAPPLAASPEEEEERSGGTATAAAA